MLGNRKKISPQGIMALKEALAVIYWKREELQDFLKISMKNSAIVGTLDWSGTKRVTVKELISRMTGNLKIYQEDIMNLILAVNDFTDFSHLDYWDEDGSKKIKAKKTVENLRLQTKGYIQITKEEELSRKRRVETERQIAKNKSLDDDLNLLKKRFNKIAAISDPQKRGYELEPFLTDLFLLYELDPKGSFKNQGEQIDGAFTFKNTDYLLEAKWKKLVDRKELASFSGKINSKIKITMGLLVTMEGITTNAISPEFKSMIIMDGSDLVAILEGRVKLPDLLYKKRRKAAETGNIFVRFHEI